MTLSIAVWSLSAMFSFTTETRLLMRILFKSSIISVGLYAAFLLHFTLEITRIKVGRSPKYMYFLYIPIGILTVLIILNTDYFQDFSKTGELWHYDHRYTSPLFITYLGYWTVFHVLSIFLLFRKIRKAASRIIKQQFRILAWALTLSMILSLLKALVLPLLFDLQSQGGTISFQLIWLFSLVFLVDRYRFLLPYRDAEREAMMELSGYSLIIMDGKGHIQIMNREAERLLGEKVHPLYRLNLKHFIHPAESFFNEIHSLQKAEAQRSFTCTVDILSRNNGNIPVDVKVSVLRDTLERRTGFLMSMKEKEHISKLRSRFNLSDREVEVLQYLVNGFSNREIAEMMYIAEATVKSHVAHIFDKLGVDNRVRVILLLKEFGLISDQTSDKEVVIL